MIDKSKYLIIVKHIFALIFLSAIGIYMFNVSYLKWPDIIVDFGRELYIPWQISQGSILYKDIAYFNGPFSPMFNSVLFKVCGVRLLTLVFFNTIIISCITFFIYKIFSYISDYIVSVVICASFLGIFAFSQYVGIGNYNYVTPYSHELVHGLLLFTAAVYFFIAFLREHSYKYIFLIGILLGIASLTKIEVFVSLLLSMFVGLLCYFTMVDFNIKKLIKICVLLLLGLLIPVCLFITLLNKYLDINDVLYHITFPLFSLFTTGAKSNHFYQRIMGVDQPVSNLVRLILMLRFYIYYVLSLALLSFASSKVTNRIMRKIFAIVLILLLICLTPFLYSNIPWIKICTPFPLLLIVIISCQIVLLIRSRNEIEVVKKIIPSIMFNVFAIVFLLKMIFNVHVYHYGFALAMPAYLVIVKLVLYDLPEFINKRYGGYFYMRLAALFIVVISITFYINISDHIYAMKTYPVKAGKEEILTGDPKYSPRGVMVQSALRKINKIMKKDDTFIVVPEGVMLNYLSRHVNPCPYVNFMPLEFLVFGENNILKSFKRSEPDYIIIVEKNTSEYGYKYFGKDYAEKVYSWIFDNYMPLDRIGNEPLAGKGFGIDILKRKEKS